MSTISENLIALGEQRVADAEWVEAIKNAIRLKNVNVPVEAKLRDLPEKVALIDEKGWLNYLQAKEGIKTTILKTDINCNLFASMARNLFQYFPLISVDLEFQNLTGSYACLDMFSYCTNLTTAKLDLRLLKGNNCMQNLFLGSTKLTNLTLNVASLDTSSNMVASIFNSITNLHTITIDGMSNQNTIWGSTSTANNLFAQTVLTTKLLNLTINCTIMPNLNIANLTVINFASVVQVLGKLFNYAGQIAHTITFNRSFTGLSQGNYDIIAAAVVTANARNWTVAGLTYSL